MGHCRCSACSFTFAPGDDLALKWPETTPDDALGEYRETRTTVHPPPHEPGGPALTMARPGPWCPGADRPAVTA